MPKTVFHTESESSLFLSQHLSSLLFLSCLLSLTHTLIVVYIPLGQLRIAVFNMCCTEPVQHGHNHSVHWPFAHPLARKHIHIQLTIHSYTVITTGRRYHTTTPVLLLSTCFSVPEFYIKTYSKFYWWCIILVVSVLVGLSLSVQDSLFRLGISALPGLSISVQNSLFRLGLACLSVCKIVYLDWELVLFLACLSVCKIVCLDWALVLSLAYQCAR